MTSKPVLLAATGLTLANHVLIRAGVRPRVDGWRRAAGLVLRGEASTFVLSAFGLDTWSDAPRAESPDVEESCSHFAQRFHSFLVGEPASHTRILKGPAEDRAASAPGPTYTLAFQPWVDGPARFIRPDEWSEPSKAPDASDPHAGVLFNAIARVDARGRADVWIRVNHVGADGVPMQEMLSRLETSWGVCEATRYPSPDQFATHAVPRPSSGRAGLAEVQTFVDFAPLLAWRKSENARLAEPMTVSAALLWWLARHPAFAGLHAGTTVEVAPSGGLGAGVGVVVVRPRDYVARSDGLRRYVADFNRRMEQTRRRVSRSCRTLDAAAPTPPRLAAVLLRHALEHSPGAFGAFALTMLKDARVFGAPIAEVGHNHGFMAIGSMSLPCADGRKVGCVTVKGPEAVIRSYPRAIADAVAAAAG